MWNKAINFNHFIHGGNNNIYLYCSAANSVAVLTFSFSINVRNNTMLTAESKGSNAPPRETDDGQKDPKTEVGESTDCVSISALALLAGQTKFTRKTGEPVP